MLTTDTVTQYLDELAAESAAPGGGSVAALCGALGAALAAMVCRLTIGKPGYEAVEEKMREVLARAEVLRGELTQLVDRDTEAFNHVMIAFKLPRETEAERQARSMAIQEAYKRAAGIPMDTARFCLDILRLAPKIIERGNKNAASDAGVCAHVAAAGLEGAALNVRINLGSIKDVEFTSRLGRALEEYQAEGRELVARVRKLLDEKLG